MAVIKAMAVLLTVCALLLVFIETGHMSTRIRIRRRAKERLNRDELKSCCPFPTDALLSLIVYVVTAMLGVLIVTVLR